MDRDLLRARLLQVRDRPRAPAALLPWLPDLERRGVCAGYLPLRGEISVEPVLRALLGRGAAVALPRVTPAGLTLHRWEGEALRRGSFGVVVPEGPLVDPDAVGTFLVPGVGFDRHGGRIGHGKGHYDRLLAGRPGRRIGVCWADQLVDEVPMDTWDQRMDAVLTEAGWAFGGP